MPQTEMEDAFYEEAKPSETTPAEPTEKQSVDQEEQETPTALLPLSALGDDVKEGDSLTIKIVKLYGDEAEVEISSGNGEPAMAGMPESAAVEFNRMEKEG